MSTSEYIPLPQQDSQKSHIPALEVERTGSYGRQFERIFTLMEIGGDALTLIFGMLLSLKLYYLSGPNYSGLSSIRAAVPWASLFALVGLLMLDRAGAYRLGNSLLRIRETEHALRASVYSFLVALPASLLTGHLVPRRFILIAIVVVPVLLTIEKQLGYSILNRLHTKGYGRQRVLIYGAGLVGKEIFSTLLRSPKLGLLPVAMVEETPTAISSNRMYASGYRHQHHIEVLPGPISADQIRAWDAEMVIVAQSYARTANIHHVLEEAAAANASVAFAPERYARDLRSLDYVDLDGLLLAFARPSNSRHFYELAKRCFDLTISGLLIVAFAPLFTLIAIAIKLDSSGPALFRQTRIGMRRKPFTMYKFRSMHTDHCGDAYSPVNGKDSRITHIGKWLRRSSLDELPQLFNVFKGDMSLVGPRPEMPFIVAKYSDLEVQRLNAKPGITGLWQLSADRRFLIHENIQYDLYYIETRGFFLDVAILLHTVFFAMHGV